MTDDNEFQLEVNHLSIDYNELKAVDNVSFKLKKGQIGCLLGPSGCGKTTVLRSVAGFEIPDAGEIILHRQLMSRAGWALATEKRRVGMVFQDFALFPHLNVFQNITFGLQAATAKEKKQRADELLKLVGLSHKINAYPHELSGGQQQRVAVARAMAPRPEILLLDEPFSDIDTEQRQLLVHDIGLIIRQEKITTLMVTHDQLEAFAIADEIGVMKNGKMHQWSTGFDLYHKPNDLFVASFVGQGVLLECTILDNNRVDTELGIIQDGRLPGDFHKGDQALVLIRPDDIIHDDDSEMTAEILEKTFRGAEFLYSLRLPTGGKVLCFAPSHHNHKVGEHIGIRHEIDHLVTFKST
jgi:iron(III) transport system ATP-binding protein